jgi:hypothetical protein
MREQNISNIRGFFTKISNWSDGPSGYNPNVLTVKFGSIEHEGKAPIHKLVGNRKWNEGKLDWKIL